MNVLSSEDLIFAIEKYLNLTLIQKERQRHSGKWVRENYFEKNTAKGVNNLLNL